MHIEFLPAIRPQRVAWNKGRMTASRRIGLTAWAIEELRQLAQCDDRDDPMARRLRVRLAAVEAGSDSTIG
jgi:hypothetical protein